nr:MAG TPA: hypothetical protein [Bacteriophage sp.]
MNRNQVKVNAGNWLPWLRYENLYPVTSFAPPGRLNDGISQAMTMTRLKFVVW